MKKVCLCLVFVFFGVTVFSAAAFGQKRSITEKDLFNFRWIGNPQISPDGKQVAFVRIVVDEKRDSYETAIWGVSVDGAEGHGFTSGKHDTSPQWSPDGRYLAFVRTTEKDGKPQPPQIFILPMAGGEAWQLTRLPKGASGPVWSPDGKTLAFSSSTNAEDLAKAACEDSKGKGKDKDKDDNKDNSACSKPEHEPDIHVITRAVYRNNDEGYLDFSRPEHIWSIAFPSNPQELPQPKQLTRGDYDEDEIVWANDGSKIYFTSDRELEPYYGLGQNVDLFGAGRRRRKQRGSANCRNRRSNRAQQRWFAACIPWRAQHSGAVTYQDKSVGGGPQTWLRAPQPYNEI